MPGPPLDVPGTGVLPAQWLEKALATGVVAWDNDRHPAPSVQPASIDLRLGDVAYRLRCSFLADRSHTVEERLQEFGMGELDLRDGGAVLETSRPYLIPLVERLALPQDVRAKANPKSSTGRIDVFTRVITDNSYRFDEVAPGYTGPLWIEVISNTFTVKVHPGLSLNQLRLSSGVGGNSTLLRDDDVRRLHQEERLLFHRGAVIPPDELALADGLFLGLDLDRAEAGYKAKKNSRLLDLGRIGEHAPADFWETVRPETGGKLVLEPGEFYLLLSAEEISIPLGHTAEMAAYDPTSGELRTHYAGFFDPGFGRSAGPGSKAALEVRAHDVPFMVQHRQPVCKLTFERMVEHTVRPYGAQIGSNYQTQQTTLSKYFRRPLPESQLSIFPEPA